MDELLRQLEALAIGAIPTLVLFIVLVLAYRYILYRPLMKVRAERRERTAGAMEKARLAIAAADARSQEYEAKLAAARLAAQQRIREAQGALEAQAAEARKQIEVTAGQLAAQVLAAVLPPAVAESSR
jgi:F-type H+-transporting ATPase subunit b